MFQTIKKIIPLIFIAVLAVGIAFFVSKFSILFLVSMLGLAVIFPIFFNLKYGIYLLFGSLVAGQLIRVPLPFGEGGILVSDIVTGLVLLSWILKKLVLKEKFSTPPLTFPIFGFAVIAIISLLLNGAKLAWEEMLASGFYIIRWIEYAGIYFVVQDMAKDKDNKERSLRDLNIERFILGFLATGFTISILGFIQLQVFPDFSPMAQYGWDPHQGRLLSTWFDPNFLGGFFILVLLVCVNIILLYWKNKKPNTRDVLVCTSILLATPIVFIAFILSYSRSSYAAFFLAIIVNIVLYIIIESKKGRLMKVLLVGAAILFVSVAVVIVFPRAQERIQGARNIDVTAQARIESWKQAWQSIEDNYIIGVGYNTLRYTRSISTSTLHSASGTDSSLLTVWLTTGIIGLVAYLIILSSIFKKSFFAFYNKNNPRSTRALGLSLLASVIALLVHSMFVNSLLYPHIMLSLWILLGLL